MNTTETNNEKSAPVSNINSSSEKVSADKRKINHDKIMCLSRFFDHIDGTTSSYVLGYN